MEEFKTVVLKKYSVFAGRARRKEFWMFVLFSLVISAALSIVDSILDLKIVNNADGDFLFSKNTGLLSSLYSLAILIPSIAVGVRRLHDTNRSGWWYLLVLIPILGWIVLLVFFAKDSSPGDNKYGPNPKGTPAVPTPSVA